MTGIITICFPWVWEAVKLYKKLINILHITDVSPTVILLWQFLVFMFHGNQTKSFLTDCFNPHKNRYCYTIHFFCRVGWWRSSMDIIIFYYYYYYYCVCVLFFVLFCLSFCNCFNAYVACCKILSTQHFEIFIFSFCFF